MTKYSTFVSVIIPTYRRPAALAECLKALAQTDYPQQRYEVVVVDDGGDVLLDPVYQKFCHIMTLRILYQDNAGAASARNRGAAASRGEVLVFTDDDCTVASGWIRALVTATDRNPGALVGGRTENGLPGNLYSVASQLLINELCRPSHPEEGADFFAGNNLAMRRKTFRSIGGFNATFSTSAGEDRALSARFKAEGRRLIFAPDALVTHSHSLTFNSFIRQHFNYGRAAFHLHFRENEGNPLAGIPRPHFFWRLISGTARAARAQPALKAGTLCLLIALTQLVTGVGFAAEWLQPRLVVR